MNIALIGYGKMGKAIEDIAVERGHTITLKVSSSNADYTVEDLKGTDVAIEFSRPQFAEENIEKTLAAGIPVVVGTTGWYNSFDSIAVKCREQNGCLFYATNFSIGVNLFFAINRQLARLMNPHQEYEVSMEEIHHIHKLDSPSGIAITLADQIIGLLDRKSSWEEGSASINDKIGIHSIRENEVPGTHSITYESPIDRVTITHEAKNRTGFATGAVLAAEWVIGRKGIYTMSDLLQL